MIFKYMMILVAIAFSIQSCKKEKTEDNTPQLALLLLSAATQPPENCGYTTSLSPGVTFGGSSSIQNTAALTIASTTSKMIIFRTSLGAQKAAVIRATLSATQKVEVSTTSSGLALSEGLFPATTNFTDNGVYAQSTCPLGSIEFGANVSAANMPVTLNSSSLMTYGPGIAGTYSILIFSIRSGLAPTDLKAIIK